jgi:hypothetical protein
MQELNALWNITVAYKKFSPRWLDFRQPEGSQIFAMFWFCIIWKIKARDVQLGYL